MKLDNMLVKKVLTKHFGAPENPFASASAIARQNNNCVRLKTDIVSFYYYYFSVFLLIINMIFVVIRINLYHKKLIVPVPVNMSQFN